MKFSHKPILFSFLIVGLFIAVSCEKDPPFFLSGKTSIANFEVAREDVLRSIPERYINRARNDLHVAYQHTSHGTHVSRGMFGLQEFKQGDEELFGITNNNPTAGKLDFRDNAMAAYAANGDDAADLSRNETAFIQATRNYLDDPDNAEINVVMWSWCNIAGHDVENNYLPGMRTLIEEYGEGGSKVGSGPGKREVAVSFIFMTGHANTNSNLGEGNPKNQADLINAFCEENNQLCLDYYSIDTHDMEGNYWEDTNDDGNSNAYGGNFYLDWQNSSVLGEDFYENKTSPYGDVTFGAHNSQHITANRKAYAMWYLLACIVGYGGN